MVDEELLKFLYMCPVGLLRTAANGDVQMVNPLAAQLLLPLTRRPMLQNLFEALEGCAPELRAMAARFSAPSGPICDQHRVIISSSGPGPRVLACSLLKIDADCLMAVLQDVTRQVDQERQIRQSEAIYAALFAGVHDFALFSLDGSGNIDSWNISCERQTGFKAADIIGRDLGVLSVAEQAHAHNAAEQVAAALREGWSLRNRWCARRDGSRYWCQIMVAASHEFVGEGGLLTGTTEPAAAGKADAPITGFAVVLRDVTERHVNAEQLHRLLTTDYLTGAANRAYFFDWAEIELTAPKRQGRPIAAFMLDVDHFKTINDCFGHAAGDAVLQRLVEICHAQLRGRGVLARMGGDEFAILLPDTALPDALPIAEQICRSVASDILLPSGGCLDGTSRQWDQVGISIGCAELTATITGIDALLHAADAALYAAKRAGRGQVRSAGQSVPLPSPV